MERSIIDRALQEGQATVEELEPPKPRPRKKQRVEPLPVASEPAPEEPEIKHIHAEVLENITSPEDIRHLQLRNELKILITSRPDTNIAELEKLDAYLAGLPMDELERKIANFRIALGTAKPFADAQSVLSTVGHFLERYGGFVDIREKFLADEELVSCVDVYLPNLIRRFSIPVKIMDRITGHLSHCSTPPPIGWNTNQGNNNLFGTTTDQSNSS